jgi:hypothetical protein
MPGTWYFELEKRNPLLAKAGAIGFLIAIGLVLCSFFDQRELLGVSVWNKPIKFFLSVSIYFWTMGWLMENLNQPKKVYRISILIFLLLSGELITITFQAIQGEQSHYNITSYFDAALFQLMGIMIFLNSVVAAWVLVLFTKVKTLPKGYLRAIQIGLIIFLIAGFEGFFMAGRLGHTVGAPDGQEGIFFLGWAKAYGDLRVFHFIGLHSIQVLALIGWYFFKDQPRKITLVGLIYFILSSGTLWMALQGKSLFG